MNRQELALRVGAAEYLELAATSNPRAADEVFHEAVRQHRQARADARVLKTLVVDACHTVLLAHRFDRGSAFARLPRDVVRLVCMHVLCAPSKTEWAVAVASRRHRVNSGDSKRSCAHQ